jgi:hypothetical protein
VGQEGGGTTNGSHKASIEAEGCKPILIRVWS